MKTASSHTSAAEHSITHSKSGGHSMVSLPHPVGPAQVMVHTEPSHPPLHTAGQSGAPGAGGSSSQAGGPALPATPPLPELPAQPAPPPPPLPASTGAPAPPAPEGELPPLADVPPLVVSRPPQPEAPLRPEPAAPLTAALPPAPPTTTVAPAPELAPIGSDAAPATPPVSVPSEAVKLSSIAAGQPDTAAAPTVSKVGEIRATRTARIRSVLTHPQTRVQPTVPTYRSWPPPARSDWSVAAGFRPPRRRLRRSSQS